MTDAEPLPESPRAAATLMVLRDDPFEVLMVRRSERRSDAFSGALVFPGGVVDAEDRDDMWRDLSDGADALSPEDRALRVAACRETWEEAGILLAYRDDRRTAAAPSVRSGRTFADVVRAGGLRLPLREIVHFAHWITPERAARRFDTHFLLCPAPDGAEGLCDGRETVALEWVRPRDALVRAAGGTDRILFPTRLNLQRLAESESVADALAAARARPRFTVIPQAERRGGETVVTIAEEAGYGVIEDWRPG